MNHSMDRLYENQSDMLNIYYKMSLLDKIKVLFDKNATKLQKSGKIMLYKTMTSYLLQ